MEHGMTRRFSLLPLICGLLAPLFTVADSPALPAAEPATSEVVAVQQFPVERLLPARTVVLWLDEGFDAHQAGWDQTAANDSLSKTGVFRVGQQYVASFLKRLTSDIPKPDELDQSVSEVCKGVQSASSKGFAVAISLPDGKGEHWPRLTVVLPQGGAFAKALFKLCVQAASDSPPAPIVAKDDQRDFGTEVVKKNEEEKNEEAKQQAPQEVKPHAVEPIEKKEQAIVEASAWKTEQIGTRVLYRSVSGTPEVDACFWEERGHLVLVIGIGAIKSTLALADSQAPDITTNPIWKELHTGTRRFDRRTYGWIDVKELRAAYDETPLTARSLEAGLNLFGGHIGGREIDQEFADPVPPLNQALPAQGEEVVANAVNQLELPDFPPEVFANPPQPARIQMVSHPWLPFVRWAQIIQPVDPIQFDAIAIPEQVVPVDGLQPLAGVSVPIPAIAGVKRGIDFDFNVPEAKRGGPIVGRVALIKNEELIAANPKIDAAKNDAVKKDEVKNEAAKNNEVKPPIPTPSPLSEKEASPPSVTLKQLLTVLGLESVQTYTWQSGYLGRSLWSESYLSAPGPKRGLLGFTDQPQIRFDQLPPLPANIAAFSATSMDLNNISESSLQLIKSLAPILTGATAGKVGLAIKKWRLRNRELFGELTAGLDSLVCVYNDRTNGPLEFGPVLVWKVKNPVQLRQGLEKFIGVLNDVLQQANEATESTATDVNVIEKPPVDQPAGDAEDEQPAAAPERVAHVASMISVPGLKVVKSTHFGREFVGVQFQFINKTFTDGKLTGTSTSDIPLGIVFTVDDNWLAVSVNTQLIEAFLLRVDGKLPRWDPTAAHRDALRDLPDQFTSICVDDPRVSLPQLVSLGYCSLAWFETLLQSEQGPLKAPKVQAALPNLPPAEFIVQPLFPNITMTKVDESGVRSYTRNSLPSVTKLQYAAGYGLFMMIGVPMLEEFLPF